MDQDELIFRSLQGRISPREESALWKWREECPQHEERYQEFAAVWRATRSISERPSASSPTVDEITSEAERRRRGLWGWSPSRWQAAAMVIAFVIGGASAGFWGGFPLSDGERDEALAVGGAVVTGIGETATVRLADGTVIRLASETRLVLPPSPGERVVRLEGKGFFAVAADPDNPFLVRTPSGEARVLGTRFELDAREDEHRLLVVEGRVALATGGSEVDVRSRQLTHVRAGGDALTVEIEDVWPLLGWIGDFMAFESTPLAEVQVELQRRFGLHLEFDDPALADETVTVWFGDETIEEVMFVLCRLMTTDCSMDDSRVRMTRRR